MPENALRWYWHAAYGVFFAVVAWNGVSKGNPTSINLALIIALMWQVQYLAAKVKASEKAP